MLKVEIQSSENDPNQVHAGGNLVVELSRGGRSSTKPVCDGTHDKVGFHEREAKIQVSG